MRSAIFNFNLNLIDRRRKIGFILFVKFLNNVIVDLFVFLWLVNCKNEFSSKIFIFTNDFYKIIHKLVVPLSLSTSLFTTLKIFFICSLSELLSSNCHLLLFHCQYYLNLLQTVIIQCHFLNILYFIVYL